MGSKSVCTHQTGREKEKGDELMDCALELSGIAALRRGVEQAVLADSGGARREDCCGCSARQGEAG